METDALSSDLQRVAIDDTRLARDLRMRLTGQDADQKPAKITSLSTLPPCERDLSALNIMPRSPHGARVKRAAPAFLRYFRRICY